jgi:MSHA pilin protein MshD
MINYLRTKRGRQKGVTLVELVVSIVVISVGLAGLLVVMDRNTRSTGNPMIWHQAVAVGEAYLEEILLKPFCDPDPGNICQVSNPPGGANCTVCPAAEASRDLFDNVCDYDSLPDNVVRDQTGAAVGGLGNYSVMVNVSVAGALNGLSGGLCEVLEIQVTVTEPQAGTNVIISGYQTNY